MLHTTLLFFHRCTQHVQGNKILIYIGKQDVLTHNVIGWKISAGVSYSAQRISWNYPYSLYWVYYSCVYIQQHVTDASNSLFWYPEVLFRLSFSSLCSVTPYYKDWLKNVPCKARLADCMLLLIIFCIVC